MSNFSQTIYENLKQKFVNATKCVLKEDISKNQDTLKSYEISIVTAFNELASYIDNIFDTLDNEYQTFLKKEFTSFRDKVTRCFEKLDGEVEFPKDLYKNIVLQSVTDESFQNTTADTTVIDHNFEHDSDSDTANELLPANTMAPPEPKPLSKLDLLRALSQTINPNFNGNPNALEAFLDRIELAQQALEDDQIETLRKFVLTKLEGKARDLVSANDSLNEIKSALRKNIKPDSSKVIAGRMISLKLSKIPSADYATKAEELAEALQRSLIIEGISREKANEMAIEKTIEMCRQSASGNVRNILAAARFDNPKEVIAKLITEQTISEKEAQIFAFKRYENQRRTNFQNGFRRNFQGQNASNVPFRSNSYGQQQNKGNFSNQRGNKQGNGNRQYNVRVTENCSGPAEDGQIEENFQDQMQEQFETMTMEESYEPTFTLETNEEE